MANVMTPPGAREEALENMSRAELIRRWEAAIDDMWDWLIAAWGGTVLGIIGAIIAAFNLIDSDGCWLWAMLGIVICGGGFSLAVPWFNAAYRSASCRDEFDRRRALKETPNG